MNIRDISTHEAIQMLEHIGDGIFVVDRDRRIIYWNEGATRITGHAGVSMLKVLCYKSKLAHVDDKGKLLCENDCHIIKTLATGEEVQTRVWVTRSDGSHAPVEVHVFPLRDSEGRIIGAVEVSRDITTTIASEQYRSRLIEILRRFTPPYFFKELAEHAAKSADTPIFASRRANLTIVFYNLSGYVRAAKELAPNTTISLLNIIHSSASNRAVANGGVVDKFLGDGALTLFSQAQAAVDFGLGLLDEDLARLNKRAAELGLNPLQLRITITSGLVVLGVMGGLTRSEATVIGDPVNLANRMLRISPPRDILMTAEVRSHLVLPETFSVTVPANPEERFPELYTR